VKSKEDQDAEAVYRILEEEILPLYYKISEDGVPDDWVKVMKDSIKSNAAKFSARRMVKEYAHKFYGRALKRV
jgi:starch phosphorylase